MQLSDSVIKKYLFLQVPIYLFYYMHLHKFWISSNHHIKKAGIDEASFTERNDFGLLLICNHVNLKVWNK